MSKVICDVCGATFPETATQCPICGSAKASSAQTAANAGDEAAGYNYVKGGRFSKSNVRKRNKGKATAQRRASGREPQKKSGGTGTNIALIVVVALLLLAIAAVVIYICVKLVPSNKPSEGAKPGQSQSVPSDPVPPSNIACTDLQTTLKVEIPAAGQTAKISVQKIPAETTDQVIFESADSAIATVAADGTVTAVAKGQTVITIKCGEKTAQCTVIVTADAPGQDTPVKPEVTLKLNRTDFTLSSYGEKWKLFSGEGDPTLITWVSDDTTVCTVEDGVVTAVGPGNTQVHAVYNGETVSCTVRCTAAVVEPDTDPDVIINKTDVTIKVGEAFNLTLKKTEEGQAEPTLLEVTWTASKDGIVTIDGNKITGAGADLTGVEVSTVYEGKTYKCIVRVTAAE